MKKLLLLASACILTFSVSAQNTFPGSGPVGIGTTGPAFTLDVIGEVGFGGIGAYKKMILGTDAMPLLGYNQSSFLTPQTIPGSGAAETAFHFRSLTGIGASNKLNVLIDGLLGVGVIAPLAKLHISGPDRGGIKLDGVPAGATADKYISMWQGTNAAVIDAIGSGILYLGYDQATDIYIGGNPPNSVWKSNGNLLIGKTSQTNTDYKLDVSGKIRANEIVVNTTGADFVFEEGYKVRTLKELENFIKTNKHLPDIPPARIMQEEGVGLSELQTKLLQKIEELTLYLIEKDKQIELLKKDMEKLKNNLN